MIDHVPDVNVIFWKLSVVIESCGFEWARATRLLKLSRLRNFDIHFRCESRPTSIDACKAAAFNGQSMSSCALFERRRRQLFLPVARWRPLMLGWSQQCRCVGVGRGSGYDFRAPSSQTRCLVQVVQSFPVWNRFVSWKETSIAEMGICFFFRAGSELVISGFREHQTLLFSWAISTTCRACHDYAPRLNSRMLDDRYDRHMLSIKSPHKCLYFWGIQQSRLRVSSRNTGISKPWYENLD